MPDPHPPWPVANFRWNGRVREIARRGARCNSTIEYVGKPADQADVAVFGALAPGGVGLAANAEIALDDFRAAEQFASASLQRDASCLDDIGAVGNGERHLRILLRQ